MTTARKEIVDVSLTRWYHCISKCVRGGDLLGVGHADRKQWIEDRLKKLSSVFAISVGGFAIMDNHLHVLCRLDPDDSLNWSPEEVIRRWIGIYPPKMRVLDEKQVLDTWIADQVKDAKRVEVLRGRLTELGWFMKSLKEPLSRLANKQDNCEGAFWQARYKSIAVLDDEALLATCAYIDLNPLAAGIAVVPEKSPHTSIRQRVNHVKRKGQLDRLQAARQGSLFGSRAAGNVEQDHWLIPIEDRRAPSNAKTQSKREGMLDSFSLGSYLLFVDYIGRLFRDGKARINSTTQEVLNRLATDIQCWSDRIRKMLTCHSLRGSFFAGDAEKIRFLARKRGHGHLTNLSPQLASCS
jgi:REP element-mobilizing transposase RayT